MRIPKPIIDQIIQRNDIVNIVSDYVSLDKKGKNYFGICPFHDEKTPSFSVSPEKQIFHCFSCGEGGDAIGFLSKIENLSYLESVTKLADRVDINLTEFYDNNKNGDEIKYFKMNQFVSDYYQFALANTKEGKEAKQYLSDRGITDEIIKRFKIGLAPDSVNSLYQALKANDYPELPMMELGHVIKSHNTFYDKFKNRIMFSITDEYSNIVGFSGRLYKPVQTNEPKYINTQETPVFKKSDIIYNLGNAKKAIKQRNRVIVYEGFMDVIASVRAGVDEAIATMGTAMTQSHIRTLKRYTNNFVLCYDGDKAGIEATKRAIQLLNKENVTIFIVELPEGLDPDDFVSKYGNEKYVDYINNKQQSYKEYLYRLYYKGINFSNIQTIENFKQKVFSMILHTSRTEQEIFLNKISHDINVSSQTIQYDFEQYIKFKRQYANKNQITESDNHSFERVLRTINRYRPSKKKLEMAERMLLFMMMSNRKYNSMLSDEVSINFHNKMYKTFYYDLHSYYNLYDEFDRDTFLDKAINTKSINLQDDYVRFFQEFYSQYQNEKTEDYEDIHFDQCLNVLKTEILASHVDSLKTKLNTTMEDEERAQIGQKIMESYKKIKN